MNKLLEVLKRAHREPFKFQSDYARANAYYVAESASRGYITCIQRGSNTGYWMVTEAGVAFIEQLAEF